MARSSINVNNTKWFEWHIYSLLFLMWHLSFDLQPSYVSSFLIIAKNTKRKSNWRTQTKLGQNMMNYADISIEWMVHIFSFYIEKLCINWNCLEFVCKSEEWNKNLSGSIIQSLIWAEAATCKVKTGAIEFNKWKPLQWNRYKPMVVVGLFFQQQENVKIWIICEIIYCKLFEPKAPHQQMVNDVEKLNINKSFHFPFLSPREESPSPSTKGRIQSSPPFPARLRLFVSSGYWP